MGELEKWKREVNLAEFAVQDCGYELDRKRSTQHCLVLRGSTDKIVVGESADGHGIYYTIGDDGDSGSILDFVMHRFSVTLGGARKVLRAKLGAAGPVNKSVSRAPFSRPRPTTRDRIKMLANWTATEPYEAEYLVRDRGLDPQVIKAFGVRQDSRRNACMPHVDADGQIAGWELKNSRSFTGFSAGGRKALMMGRLDAEPPRRVVVTESAIDAMSYAQLRGERGDLYVSTGGSFSDEQRDQLVALLAKHGGAELVIATDADGAGRKAAAALAQLARAHGFPSMRDEPEGVKDWNDALIAACKASAAGVAAAPRPRGAWT